MYYNCTLESPLALLHSIALLLHENKYALANRLNSTFTSEHRYSYGIASLRCVFVHAMFVIAPWHKTRISVRRALLYKPKTVQLKVFCTALGLPDGTAEGVLLPPHVPAAHIVYTHVEPLALSGGLPCSLAERG